MNEQSKATRGRRKRMALLAAGLVAGGATAGVIGVTAATAAAPGNASLSAYTRSDSSSQPAPNRQSTPVRSDEKSVSSSIQATLRAEALKAVPGGTVYRIETDAGDGAYEVHMTKSGGSLVTVKFDKTLAVTKVETGMGTGDPAPSGHGPGAPAGGPGDGRAPTGAPSA